MNNKSNKIIKNLSNIISHNYHKETDIIKIKNMIVDNEIGTVDIFASRFLIIKPNEVDEDIHITFPFDTRKYGSFTISYVREKQNKQTDKSSIDDKYLSNEICFM